MIIRPLLLAASISATAAGDEPPQFSGIYPHLAFFNNENECGTGAVVPWAGRLWAVTYAPHSPKGSSDKLYEIDAALNMTVRPESIGGTPANRMIHRESGQLFIGPYAIDSERNVRAIPYGEMFGRPTGNARHLFDPENKIYYASMEEGIYEVDVHTLDVTTLFFDEAQEGSPKSDLPGYHGKGLYSGHGELVYANNGEHGAAAQRDPFVASGVLAEWDGRSPGFDIVLRSQFTEVTGPGGIYGNEDPGTDPVWSVGWDAQSLILMMRDRHGWQRFRLPKASHSYDGAHGWNTEWPRIREIGEGNDLLMTMHGMFWKFPRSFAAGNTGGISPRSTYLKVVGDFCRWNDHVVLGCDDTAKSEFLNKRKAKGEIAPPQSQSNLWFLRPEQLDQLGPAIGRGAVWLDSTVAADEPSDPFLLAGFTGRAVHLAADAPTRFTFEIDRDGTGQWETLLEKEIDGYGWHRFDDALAATWVRVRSSAPVESATAWFTMGGERRAGDAGKFAGLASTGDGAATGGVIRPRGANERTLHLAADSGYYILDENARLRRSEDAKGFAWLKENAAIPPREGVVSADAASVLIIDDRGRRFRIPRHGDAFDGPGPLGFGRLAREVATERDLLNCHGTFYELPAENAGGFAKMRPVSSHDLRITDYCSYRGLLVLSGIRPDAPATDHIVRSDDGMTALWLGAVDDIWELGKPVGSGGPWKDSPALAGVPSDPYLMTGYDEKTLTLTTATASEITIEIDISGTGRWVTYDTVSLEAGAPFTHDFPDAFAAYWIRFTSERDTSATARLDYR